VCSPPDSEPSRSTKLRESPFSWRAILEIVQALALAVVISGVLNLFVVQVTEVRQQSMRPTLEQKRWRSWSVSSTTGFARAVVGDINVFNPPVPDATIPYVKRVIAVGGETIDLRNGNVFVNGQQVDIPQATARRSRQSAARRVPFTVPDGTGLRHG